MGNIFSKIKNIYMCIIIIIVLILVLGIVFSVVFLLNQLDILSDDDLASFTDISSSSSVSVDGFVQYYQGDYSDVSYGFGTEHESSWYNMANTGCGPTSFAMVASTISGKEITPKKAVNWCKNTYYVEDTGTDWSYFEAAKDHFSITGSMTTTTSIDTVYTALQSGALVISSQSEGLFTSGGHFIVLAGIYSDGGIIVRDPNKYNAVNNGYNERSFTKEEINQAAKNYWIFTY